MSAHIDALPEEHRPYAQMVLAQRAGERKTLAPPKQFGIDAATAKEIRTGLDFVAAAESEEPAFPKLPATTAGLDLTPRGRPPRYSVTTLQKAEGCILGMRFARDYDSTGVYAVIGHLVHAIVDRIVLDMYGAGMTHIDPDDAMVRAAELLTEPHEVSPMSLEVYTEVITQVGKWALMDSLQEEPDMLMTEVMFEHQIEGKPWTFSGRADRVEIVGDVAHLRDYKTGEKVLNQAEFERSVQLPIYAWHVALEYPWVKTVNVANLYTRHGIVRPYEIDVSELRVERYMATVAAMIDLAYEKNDFPATPGDHCWNCSHPQGCPKRGLSSFVPPELSDVPDLISWAIVTEQQLKASKAMIRAAVERQGLPIAIGEGQPYAEIVTSYPDLLDKEAMEAWVIEHDGDPKSFLKPQGTRTELKIRKGGEQT